MILFAKVELVAFMSWLNSCVGMYFPSLLNPKYVFLGVSVSHPQANFSAKTENLDLYALYTFASLIAL